MEKQQVFYIHGGESYDDYADFIERLKTKDIWDLPSTQSQKKWTNSFAADLGDEFEVFMPAMPNKNNAKYEEWKIWFEKHFEYLRDDVVVIGCSLGAMFLTKYFTENQAPFSIKELIIMACPVQDGTFSDNDCGDFLTHVDDLPALTGKAKNIVIMQSKDDFLVPYEHALKYKAALPEAELVTFEDKNHFLVEELPELVERIKQLG
jgi:predicted alpha/beta hydrolase family esterase